MKKTASTEQPTMTDMQTSQTEKNAPVSVVRTSPARQYRKTSFSLLLAAGLALQAFQAAEPQLLAAYPAWKWLPAAMSAAGAILLFLQRAQDSGDIRLVNYSEPPDAPQPTLPEGD